MSCKDCADLRHDLERVMARENEQLNRLVSYRERMAEIRELYSAYQEGHPHDGVPAETLLEIAESVILGMNIQALDDAAN